MYRVCTAAGTGFTIQDVTDTREAATPTEIAEEIRAAVSDVALFRLVDREGWVRRTWLTTEANATRYAARRTPYGASLVGHGGRVLADFDRLQAIAETAR